MRTAHDIKRTGPTHVTGEHLVAANQANGAREHILLHAVDEPRPGQQLTAVQVRRPYASGSSLVLVPSAAMALMPAKTASTSALEGFCNKLSAMARAVRRRSYAAIAASSSRFGALARCIASKRRSNASVMSMGVTSSKWKDHRSAQQDGRALTQTLMAVAAFALVLGALGPALDGDHYGTPVPTPPASERAAVEILADKHCQSRGGENAAWVKVDRDGAFVCTDKRGRRHGSVITILHRAEP